MGQLEKLNILISLDDDVIEEIERDIKINRIPYSLKTTIDDALKIANIYMIVKSRIKAD